MHGIPGDRVIDDGDIVSIDCGAIVEGWHADAAVTIPVGAVDDESQRLIEYDPGLARRRDRGDRRPGTVSATSAPRSRTSPVRAATRSCGSTSATASARRCTRSPRSRTTARPGRGLRLREGMVLAIEPMLNAGAPDHPRARRRLDGRDRRRQPLGALRAHGRGHRARPGGPDPPVTAPDRARRPRRRGLFVVSRRTRVFLPVGRMPVRRALCPAPFPWDPSTETNRSGPRSR